MKLSELPDSIFKIVSKEELDLDLPVKTATISVVLKRGEEIVIHNWEYTEKTPKNLIDC